MPPPSHAGSSAAPKVVVVGSINLDLVINVSDLPRPGETVTGEGSREFTGGKGANQAVAAAKAGGDVAMIGRVGDDAFGDRLRAALSESGVDTTAVQTCENCASGLATITVDRHGENAIVVVPGANGRLTPDDVDRQRHVIETSDVLLLQLEVPVDTCERAAAIARESGVRVILDPAPAPDRLPDGLWDVDLICPNESEAERLTGLPVGTAVEAERAAARLADRGPRAVVVTRGGEGCQIRDGDRSRAVPTPRVDVVDSTAAGDTFAGALAVRWAETGDLVGACRWAAAAGAIAVSRPGAQAGIPDRAAIDALAGRIDSTQPS